MATLPLPSTVGNNESLTLHLLRRASHHPVLPTWGPSAPTPAARLGFMDHSVNTIFTSSPGTFYPSRSLFHHLPVIVVPPPTPLPSANPSLTISPHHSHHFLHSRSSLKRLVFASTQLEAMFKCYEPTVTQTLKNGYNRGGKMGQRWIIFPVKVLELSALYFFSSNGWHRHLVESSMITRHCHLTTSSCLTVIIFLIESSSKFSLFGTSVQKQKLNDQINNNIRLMCC